MESDRIRLHKFLARAGVGSRRHCETWIAEGRVRVGDRVVTEMGFLVDPKVDEVVFEERTVRLEPRVTYLFHKPKGVVSTSADDEKRPRVIDFFRHLPFRVYPAGRLDEASEGLILVTNDGEFANRVTHPRYGIPKTYQVRCRGHVSGEVIGRIRQGVWLDEGKTSPARVEVRKRGRQISHLQITLFEGRNREIRRLFARFGHPVLSLKRVRIGSLTLRRLPKGKSRKLKPDEIEQLLTGRGDRKSEHSPRRGGKGKGKGKGRGRGKGKGTGKARGKGHGRRRGR